MNSLTRHPCLDKQRCDTSLYNKSKKGDIMPNIKPISDLRNYGEVLRDVVIGSPVFLTKNGRGRYAVVDIDEYKEYEKTLAWRKLMSELDKGRHSGETDGWISADEVKLRLEERYGGDYRFLVCGSYLAFYHTLAKKVYIDRILYGKRDYIKILFGDSTDTET
jgi:prevent-host-death family protein